MSDIADQLDALMAVEPEPEAEKKKKEPEPEPEKPEAEEGAEEGDGTEGESSEEDEPETDAGEDSDGEPSDEEDERDEILALRAQIETMNEKLAQLSAKAKPAAEPAPEWKDEVFVTEEEEQPNWNVVLNKVAKQAYNTAVQDVLKRVPTIMSETIGTELENREMVREFWSRNKDLKEHRDYVAVVFRRQQAQYPEQGANKLLELTAAEVRKRLGKAKSSGPKRPTVLPKGARGPSRPQKPKAPAGITEQIRSMANV